MSHLIWTFGAAILLILLLGIWLHLRNSKRATDDYWPSRNFPYFDGSQVLGGLLHKLRHGVMQHENDSLAYHHVKRVMKKPFAGFFELSQRSIFLTDLDLLKVILVKDFEYFMDRREIA